MMIIFILICVLEITLSFLKKKTKKIIVHLQDNENIRRGMKMILAQTNQSHSRSMAPLEEIPGRATRTWFRIRGILFL